MNDPSDLAQHQNILLDLLGHDGITATEALRRETSAPSWSVNISVFLLCIALDDLETF